MRLHFIHLLIILFGITTAAISQSLQLDVFAENFKRPVDIANAGDERLFIVEKDGTIAIVQQDGKTLIEPFLDIRGRVNAFANERGLLGLAFHPDYKENGYLYIHYTNSQGNSVISRFSVDPANPNKALPNSELILMTVIQPFNNHNAGDLNFGPDGYLYIAMGDGGSGGDPGNRSQNPKNLLGKILRINVNEGALYSIPADNPFAGNTDTLEEIWSLGWRNPWRFSFDRLTGDMWIADVGQNNWEEINMEVAGTGGLNYGWRCYEGNAPFNTLGCKARENYTFPIHVYPNRFDVGCSVTGGYVYRGSKYPGFAGKYLYADFCTGIFWMLEKVGQNWINTQLADLDNQEFVTFGEDTTGELYVAGLASGIIYKITDVSCSEFNSREIEVIITNPVCPEQCTGTVEITGDTSALTLLWEDGAIGFRKENLCPGSLSFLVSNNDGCRKEFNIEIAKPTQDSLSIIAIQDSLFAVGSSMQLYQWFYNNALIAITSDPFWVPASSGNYYVKGTNSFGCEVNSDTLNFISSSVKQIKNITSLKILQNPVVNKTLSWVAETPERQIRAAIVSMDGTLIDRWQSENYSGAIQTKNLDNLTAGQYILIINGHGYKFILL